MSTETYSVGHASSGWTAKRYFGIPVVYLAGAIVAILIIVAYMGSKKNTTGASASPAAAAAPDPYTALNSTGTVTTGQPVYYVGPNSNNVDTPVAKEMTNSEWNRQGIAFLVSSGYSALDAQLAMQMYMTGQDLTYKQGDMINQVVAKYGTPPTPTNVGNVAPAPTTKTSTAPENTSAPVNVVRIQNAYKNYLGRNAGAGEVLWWSQYMITNNVSIDTVEMDIYNSNEGVAHRAATGG